jgi:hypothetical protein
MAVVVIRYEAKTTTRRALTFIVGIFVNDTIAITVWASFCFHVFTSAGGSGPEPGPPLAPPYHAQGGEPKAFFQFTHRHQTCSGSCAEGIQEK